MFLFFKKNKLVLKPILLGLFIFLIWALFFTGVNAQAVDQLTGDNPAVDASCFSWGVPDVGGCLLLGFSWILSWLQVLFSFLLSIAVWFFEFAVDQSINSISIYANLDGVLSAWKVLRDISNMMFLLVMMYMAIGTVLQLDGVNWKKMIGSIIVAAIMINFSMSITKIVIDSSNVFAVYFYELAKGGPDGKGIPRIMLDSIQIERVIAKQGTGSQQASTQVPSALAIIVNTIGSIGLIIATSFVLFVAGFLFIVRLITLIFSMITSPLPWLGMVLPKFGSKLSGGYWDTLLNQAFFAPAYTFCIYFVMKIISCTNPSQIAQATGGGYVVAGAMPMLMYYVIVISLMFGAIVVAKKMGAEGMGYAQSGAKWLMGATLGVGAIATTGIAGGLTRFAGRGIAGGASVIDKKTGGAGTRSLNVLADAGKWAKATAPIKAASTGVDYLLKTEAGKAASTQAGMMYEKAKAKATSPLATGVSALEGISESVGAKINIMPSSSSKEEKEYIKKKEEEAKKNKAIELGELTDEQIAKMATDENKSIEEIQSQLSKEIENMLKNFRGDKIMSIGIKNLKKNNAKLASWLDETQYRAIASNPDTSPEDLHAIEDAMFENAANIRGRRAVENSVITRKWGATTKDKDGVEQPVWTSDKKEKVLKNMTSRNLADLSDVILESNEFKNIVQPSEIKELNKQGRRDLAERLSPFAKKNKPSSPAQDLLGGEEEVVSA